MAGHQRELVVCRLSVRGSLDKLGMTRDLALDGTRSLPLNAHALTDLIRSRLTKAVSNRELG